MSTHTNWGGNVTYHAARWHRPRSVGEVQDVVRRAAQVRVLGTRHSFNGLADTAGDLISLEHLDRVVALDAEQRTVTVEGGVRYGELGRWLHGHGFALHGLASLPHLSVAGACATATHGSGDHTRCLAAAVTALELVTADGEVRQVSRERDGEAFGGMVVALGALGVVTRLTLAVEPTYAVRQDVYEGLSLAHLESHFDAVTSGADSVSLFTTWQAEVFHQVWLKRRVEGGSALSPPPTWFGTRRAEVELHPIPGLPAESCTPQLGVVGPWFERWPHFRLSHTPSHGEEVQSEYFVPRVQAVAALRLLFALGPRLAPLLRVSEVRTVAADDLWLSPCFGGDRVAIHFTWRRDEEAVRALLTEIEAALAPLGACPHWGKVFVTSPERIAALHPRLPDFRRLCAALDPVGKFSNPFVTAFVRGAGPAPSGEGGRSGKPPRSAQ